jgi:hypothetical protein
MHLQYTSYPNCIQIFDLPQQLQPIAKRVALQKQQGGDRIEALALHTNVAHT